MSPHVVYLCPNGVPILGDKGASVHVRSMAEAFRRQGCNVTILAADLGSGNALDPSIRVEQIQLPGHQRRLAKSIRVGGSEERLRISREVSRLLLNPEIELALDQLSQEGPIDLIYERIGLWGYAGVDYARRHGLPIAVEVNAPLVEETETYRQLMQRGAALDIEAHIYRNATALLAVSQELKDYIMQRGGEEARIHVLPNAVDAARFHPQVDGGELRRRLGVGPASAEILVGFAGSLKPWHGVSLLLEAVAILRDRGQPHRLLIVGDGPGAEALRSQATELGLEGAALFTGAVPHKQLPLYIAAMDIAVAPHGEMPHFYFSPLKLFEYAAIGKPIVASRSGQVGRLFAHEETALLVPPGDRTALCEALTTLGQSPDLSSRLGSAAATGILSQFTWDHNASYVLRVVGLQGRLPSADKQMREGADVAPVAG